MKIIDAHNHFWKFNETEFGWINKDMDKIRQDFLPKNLALELDKSGVEGVVSVQARQSLEETEWLLDLSDQYDFIKGIVGWLPILKKSFEKNLDQFALNRNLKALRHVIHDEKDELFILRKDFNRGIKLLKKYNLVYDILIFEKHLPQTIAFVDMHPDQVFVLDHIAKPLIKQNIISPWRDYIFELSKRDNVYCKISGLVTEADYGDWTDKQLQIYMDIVFDSFGPEKLMFGSDWPVCLVSCEYYNWLDIVKKYIRKLSIDDQEKFLFKNAVKVYGLADY